MIRFLAQLDRSLAILLIEHDMDVVFDVAEHISVLHFGQVLEAGSAEQIRCSEKVQQVYLGTG
jgi:branched-chain amino acid transport system ATP-binding protein